MIKRIIGCITLSCISAFAQAQFQPTGGNNPSHVTVGGGTSSGTTGVALTTFNYGFNAVTNTIYVNSNAYPELVIAQLALQPGAATPGYGLLNIVASTQTYQVLYYATNGNGSTSMYPDLVGIIP